MTSRLRNKEMFGKMQALSLGILTLSATLLIGNQGAAKAAEGLINKNVKDRQVAPNFQSTDSNDNRIRLSDFKGKVILLNFWATWCGPCKAEIPWFEEFESKYRNRGLAVLGVAMDDGGWSAVRPSMTQTKMNYRVILGDDATASKYGGVESLPETLLIDRQGRIAARLLGLTARATYEQAIEELLRQ
jgi:thiol-disulfide isomerase/thioredoxin